MAITHLVAHDPYIHIPFRNLEKQQYSVIYRKINGAVSAWREDDYVVRRGLGMIDCVIESNDETLGSVFFFLGGGYTAYSSFFL